MKKLSVSQLNNYIKGVFEDELVLHSITVFGELEDFKQVKNASYFTIKDENSRLQCVKWGSLENLENGTQVEVFGKVQYYQKTGKVSFVAMSVKPTGKGKHSLELLRLKERLEGEGLFDNKKEIPKCITRVALITSDTGAVVSDFTRIIEGERVIIDITIISARVQGEDAEKQLVKALEFIKKKKNSFDIAVIMRGGGSEGDLEVFNSERVARAVAGSPVFTISAIGHETDTTVCDLVADYRCPTPSAAASLIANSVIAKRLFVLGFIKRLDNLIKELYNYKYAKTILLSTKLEKMASGKVLLSTQKCYYLISRAEKSILGVFNQKKASLALLAGSLNNKSPLKLLESGFTVVEKKGKRIFKSSVVSTSDEIDIHFSDGSLHARVTKKTKREIK